MMRNMLTMRNFGLLMFLCTLSFALVAQPLNDDCEFATELIAGQILLNETNIGSTFDISYNSNVSSCSGNNNRRSVWYKYEHYTNGAIKLRVDNFNSDLISMIITDGPCGNFVDGFCGDISDIDQYFCNLPSDLYFIQIATRANSVDDFDIVVDSEDEISVAVNIENVSCFGDNDGAVEIIPSGGIAPYSYTLGSETNTDGIFENLSTGNYNAIVEDATFCTLSLVLNIVEPDELMCAFSQVINPNCGLDNGSFTVDPQGGTGPYSFSIISGQSNSSGNTTGIYMGLESGTYVVKIDDVNGCNVACNVSLVDTAPPSCAVTNSNNPHCSIDNGTFEVEGQGGTPPYTYEIISGNGNDSGNSTGFYSNLGPGTYEIELTDDDGCNSICMISLDSPPRPSCSISIDVQPSCGNADGSFTVSASGGDPGYDYEIISGNGNNSGNNNGVYINMEADFYMVEITDASNCKDTCEIDLQSLSGPKATVTNLNGVSCFGGNNGTATANASDGTLPYMYLWSNGSDDRVQLNLAPGEYSVTVTDSGGCTDKETINIEEPGAISCDIIVDNVGCFGSDNGRIEIECNGGTAPFSYTIDNVTNDTGVFSNLTAGSYDILIEDANGCTTDENAVVDQSPPITCQLVITNEQCSGDGQGSVRVMVSGGSGNDFTFTLVDQGINNTTGFFEDLIQGNYEVHVEDAGGCETSCFFEIEPGAEKPKADFTAVFNSNPTGNIAYNQEFELKNLSIPGDNQLDQSKTAWEITNISNPSFSFNNDPFPVVGLDCVQNLLANATNNLPTEVEIMIEIEDENGCKDQEKFDVDFFNANNCHIIVEDIVMCEGDTKEIDIVFNTPNNSVISCELSQNIFGITVIYDDENCTSNKTATVIASTEGVSFLTFTFKDEEGCTAEKEVEVTVLKKPSPPNLSLSSDTICSGSNLIFDIIQSLDVYPAKINYIINNDPEIFSATIFDANINTLEINDSQVGSQTNNTIRFVSISDNDDNCLAEINNLSFDYVVTDLDDDLASLSLTSSQFCEGDQIAISYNGPIVSSETVIRFVISKQSNDNLTNPSTFKVINDLSFGLQDGFNGPFELGIEYFITAVAIANSDAGTFPEQLGCHKLGNDTRPFTFQESPKPTIDLNTDDPFCLNQSITVNNKVDRISEWMINGSSSSYFPDALENQGILILDESLIDQSVAILELKETIQYNGNPNLLCSGTQSATIQLSDNRAPDLDTIILWPGYIFASTSDEDTHCFTWGYSTYNIAEEIWEESNDVLSNSKFFYAANAPGFSESYFDSLHSNFSARELGKLFWVKTQLKENDCDTDECITQAFYYSRTLAPREANSIEDVDIKVYPNPSSDYISLSLEGAFSDNYEYVIVNKLGQIVTKGILQKNEWSHQKILSIAQYPRGLYTLQIVSSKKDYKTFKIIKI